MLPKVESRFKGYIFDLDGTIWLSEHPIPGAVETIAGLRARGCAIRFLTNNSDGTQAMFAKILTEIGIPAQPEEVISVSYVLANFLKEHHPHSCCYVIGADPVREELTKAGMILRDRPEDIDFVVLGIDRDFTYRKLQTAFLAIRHGARFIATNEDPYCPSAGGDLADIGALIAAIETASEHKLDVLVGKPNPMTAEWAIQSMNLPKEDCLIIGDQLRSDITAGKRAGILTALLMRDPLVVDKLKMSIIQPDFGLASLSDLLV